MDPAVASDEELPDGRRLVVFADGREVVVGVARARPHPVAGWDWIRRPPPPPARPRAPIGRGHARVQIGGVRARPAIDPSAEARAEALLISLLDPDQQRDYHRTRGFWVPTPRGPVRLGRLYQLVHRPDDRPDVERVLCVVPRTHADLPRADIWTNLLLTLAVEPDRFFRVANLVEVRPRPRG